MADCCVRLGIMRRLNICPDLPNFVWTRTGRWFVTLLVVGDGLGWNRIVGTLWIHCWNWSYRGLLPVWEVFRLLWLNNCVGVFAAVTFQVMVPAMGVICYYWGWSWPIVAVCCRSLPVGGRACALVLAAVLLCALGHFFENSNFVKYIVTNFHDMRVCKRNENFIQALRLYWIVHDCQVGPVHKNVSRCEFLTRI